MAAKKTMKKRSTKKLAKKVVRKVAKTPVRTPASKKLRGKKPTKGATRVTPKPTARKAPARNLSRTKPRPAKKAAPSAARTSIATAAPGHATDRVVVENVNVPGYKTSVDARKYAAMRETLLSVLPKTSPGMTQAEMLAAVTGKLPEAVFPRQEKAGWWAKCVQLDLEAKRVMTRDAGKPLRWRAL